MKLYGIVLLWALLTITHQTKIQGNCVCEFISSERSFPHEKLQTLQDSASNCNNNVTPQKTFGLESLLLGLDRRLPQLEDDVAMLEKEDDGELYGVLSLHVIENELTEIQQLIDKLNSTTFQHKLLSDDTAQKLENVKEEMEELETFDAMQVVKNQQANQRLKRDLDQCRNGGLYPTPLPTKPTEGTCPHGRFLNVTGPRIFTAGEYPGSYKYGAWGRDPKPEEGKNNWYWLVMMTISNVFSNYVRFYSSLSSLIVGVSTPGNVLIHTSNPTTNTIQGPNVVLYEGGLYYNCYNSYSVCQFNLTTKSITTLQLPQGTRYNSKANFCHLDECYVYTDLDLVTDESGVWVVYTTTQDFGYLVLSKVEVEKDQLLTLGQTWRTSFPKNGVTNTFMACGVLYATRYVDKNLEEIFYSFDTTTGKENFNVGVFLNKMSPSILSLNYSPVDQMLYAYCDSKLVSYEVLFQKGDDYNLYDSFK